MYSLEDWRIAARESLAWSQHRRRTRSLRNWAVAMLPIGVIGCAVGLVIVTVIAALEGIAR